MQSTPFALIAQSSEIEELVRKANEFIHGAKAPSTRKAYLKDWRDFEIWCSAHHLPSMPSSPEVVALYITDCAAKLAPATIARRLASITKAHQAGGIALSPASTKHFVVSEVLKGLRRKLGIARNCKDPLLIGDIRRIIDAAPASLLGLRDSALILVGFAGAFRRSELAALETTDLTFSADFGLVIRLRHSKTDQEGAGREIAIPFGEHLETCPVRALRAWMEAASITGPLFREVDRHGKVSPHGLHKDSIGSIVKRAAKRAELNAANISGHSMRAGLATQAAMNGADERVIAKTTGHKSRRVLRRYIRIGSMYRENAASSLGL